MSASAPRSNSNPRAPPTRSFAIRRSNLIGRIAMERRPVLIPDVLCDPEYAHHELQEILGHRSTLGIPLLRGNELIGIFASNRSPLPSRAR